jgi:glucose/arabinose dehydrogenase
VRLAAQSSRGSDSYMVEAAFPLKFEQPIGIVSPPGETNRLFVLEKPGRIMVISDLAHPTAQVFLDLRKTVGDDEVEQGVLALAFHPDYARNRQFYVWYTSDRGGIREDRLSRFLVSPNDPNRADPSSEQQLIAQADDAPNHNGGELLFGPEGYLYLSLGDEGGANDQYRNSQRIDRDFFAGILRIDVDQRPENLRPNAHPAVRPGTYAVPRDNPFVETTTFNGARIEPAKVRTEFWAVGLRNPWRMSFDPATGRLWCADVGQNLHEEIDLITRGGNYGWNFREGKFPFRGTPPSEAKFVEPIWDYPHSQGISVTGGLVYHGKNCPELEGKYLFADYGFGAIWALTPDGEKPVSAERVKQIATAPGIVSFGRDPRNGDVLFASLAKGQVLRLVPKNAAAR